MQQNTPGIINFLFYTSLQQRLIAIAVAFGIAILLLGESYLATAALSCLRWLPRWLIQGFNLPLWVIYIGLIFFFNMLLNSSSGEHGPLEQMLLRQGFLGTLRGFLTIAAIVLYWLASRLVKIKPPKDKPMPRFRWAALALFPLALVASIGLGLLLGLFPSEPGTFEGLLTTVPIPFLQWPLSVAPVVALIGFLLPFVLVFPYWVQLPWRIERLPVSRFVRVGAWLIGIGSGIVMVTALLLIAWEV